MSKSTNNLKAGSVVIGQSGGPTAVINQSLVGVVETLRGHDGIGPILGCHHAVEGIINDKFIELQNIPQDRLERVANSPGAALGSSRKKPDAKFCKQIFDRFAERDVRYFFYIGGNDSSDTCRIVNELAKKAGYDLCCFHVPKTIDNDLVHSDHTPGFGSAAKFVAQAFIGDNIDNRALPGIKIDVVMGRHAGFLTAASIMARQHEDDGPHLIYVPEATFNVEQFLGKVEACYTKHGRCLVAVSEGIHDSDGEPIVKQLAKLERDEHGNLQLSGTGALGDHLSQAVQKHLGPKARVRADTFGYMQRSFAGCTSVVDAQEARKVGRRAAKAALDGLTEGSISIIRTNSAHYKADYRITELSAVAGKTRTLDHRFILHDCDIDDRFKDYVAPLIGPLPIVEALRVGRG